jgi:hypothetical protein
LNLEDEDRHYALNFCSAGLLCFLAIIPSLADAQDLAPRAYIITPIHSNAVTLTYGFYDGEVLLDGALPISGVTARFSVPVFSIFHSMRIAGRTANFTAAIPYGIGNLRGTVAGTDTNAYRSGLFDSSFRFSVNLKGGSAMDVADFRNWRQTTLIGVSLKVVTPSGEYDPTKLINYGAHRWSFKPEIGLSRRWDHWVVDTYGAVWFFSANNDFFSRNQFSPGTNTQSQKPITAFEGHLSYDVRPRLWASIDGNFWLGGRTSLNGVDNPHTLQKNSRIGGAVSLPVSKHESLKFSYNRGAFVRYGGSYANVSVGWQYSWMGRPN